MGRSEAASGWREARATKGGTTSVWARAWLSIRCLQLRSQALRDLAQEKWVQLHKILITEIKETAEITQPATLRQHEASMFKLLSSFLVTHRSISFTLLTSDLDHKPERVFQLEPLVMTVNSKPPVILSCTSESPLVLERTSKGEKNFPWSLVPSRHERRAARCSPVLRDTKIF